MQTFIAGYCEISLIKSASERRNHFEPETDGYYNRKANTSSANTIGNDTGRTGWDIEGHKYLDGGVADSIPSAWLFAQGYDRNVVVLTQPAGFVKQPNSVMPMLRRVYRHYPEFVAALAHRHEVYNATLDDLARREAAGEIFVVRPSESVKVPSLCREPDELERVYQIGRRDAEATLPALETYLAG